MQTLNVVTSTVCTLYYLDVTQGVRESPAGGGKPEAFLSCSLAVKNIQPKVVTALREASWLWVIFHSNTWHLDKKDEKGQFLFVAGRRSASEAGVSAAAVPP